MIVRRDFCKKIKTSRTKTAEKLKTAFRVSILRCHLGCYDGSHQQLHSQHLSFITLFPDIYYLFVDTAAPTFIWPDFETISRKAAIRGHYDGMANSEVKGQHAVVSVSESKQPSNFYGFLTSRLGKLKKKKNLIILTVWGFLKENTFLCFYTVFSEERYTFMFPAQESIIIWSNLHCSV